MHKVTAEVKKKKKGGGTTQAGIEQFHCMKFHFLRAIHQVVFV